MSSELSQFFNTQLALNMSVNVFHIVLIKCEIYVNDSKCFLNTIAIQS